MVEYQPPTKKARRQALPLPQSPVEKDLIRRAYKTTLRSYGVRRKRDITDPTIRQHFRKEYADAATLAVNDYRNRHSANNIELPEEPKALEAISLDKQTPPDVVEKSTIEFQETRPIERPLSEATGLNMPKGIEETATKIMWQAPTTRSSGEAVLLDMRVSDVWPFTIHRGYAGLGKTASLINWGMKNGYKVYVHGASSDQDLFDYVGSYIVKGNEMIFQASAITSAVEESKRSKVLLVIDEINQMTPEVTKALASLFDDHRTVRIPGGEINGSSANLRIIGTMNKEADSAGSPLDPAFKSRAIIADVDGDKVVKALIKEGEITPNLGKVMRDTNYRFAIREVRQLKALMSVMPGEEALETLVQKYDEGEDRNLVIQAFRNVYGAKLGKTL